MSYVPAQRNHYNPCFWTALWNVGYFQRWTTDLPAGDVRKQVVHVLNLRGDKILRSSVERVHYDKHLCLAEIPAESPRSLYLDFENTLTSVENLQAYQALRDVAKGGEIRSVEHKGFLTCLLVLHAMRSHEFMNVMINPSVGAPKVEKWEYFLHLKDMWSDPLMLSRAVAPLAMGQWIFYRTSQHHFPLPDSPIMVNRDSVMAVLSPRLLLEINLNVIRDEDHWIVREGISRSKFSEFRRRTIANTFKEIIFNDDSILLDWCATPEYKRRKKAVKDARSSRLLLEQGATRVLWMINGMGRVPDTFEEFARPYFQSHSDV